MKITKQELIDLLKDVADKSMLDREASHEEADKLLLAFIDDKEIEDVYNSFGKWYA